MKILQMRKGVTNYREGEIFKGKSMCPMRCELDILLIIYYCIYILT